MRVVVEAQLSPYWAHGQLEVPEIKWVLTNNYKFHIFRSVHCHPSLSPRLSFWFFRGSGSETTFGCSNIVIVWRTHLRLTTPRSSAWMKRRMKPFNTKLLARSKTWRGPDDCKYVISSHCNIDKRLRLYCTWRLQWFIPSYTCRTYLQHHIVRGSLSCHIQVLTASLHLVCPLTLTSLHA